MSALRDFLYAGCKQDGLKLSAVHGCVNGSGTLKIRTTKEFDDSTVAKILELVENASSKKAKVENFITRFAKYYTPVVTIGALSGFRERAFSLLFPARVHW